MKENIDPAHANCAENLENIYAILKESLSLANSDPQKGLEQAKIAYQMAKELNNVRAIMSAMAHLAKNYTKSGNYPQAEKWANRLLKKSLDENIVIASGTAYTLLGNCTHKQSKYSESLQHYLNALEAYQKVSNKREICATYNNLGTVHLLLKECDEALNYFNLTLENMKTPDPLFKVTVQLNIANVLYNQEKYLEALEIYKESAEQYRKLELYAQEISALNNVGITYTQMKDYSSALKFLLKAHSLNKKFNDKAVQASICLDIAEAYLKMNILEKVAEFLQEAETLDKENDLQWNLRHIYATYADYYTVKNDLGKANEYLRKQLIANEEYYRKSHDEKIFELETKYKTKIYMQQSSELDKKNKIMCDQIDFLKSSLDELRLGHDKLKTDFEEKVTKLNAQDNLLASQSRMSVMGEMISAIAHQWKQPLNVIGVLSQSIGDAWDFEELTDEFLNNQIELILEQVQYMSQTITDFRDFFKEDNIIDFKVADAVNKAIKIVSYLLKHDDIKIKIDLDSNCCLSGNPSELSQVIINIINNARQAMMENNVADPEINITLLCSDNEVIIKIFNKGEPIPTQNLEKIFDPYFTTRRLAGTGIGLHICRRIIENKFQGSIKAENLTGGVLFTVIGKKTVND
jgi:signal transduction histidine kinase